MTITATRKRTDEERHALVLKRMNQIVDRCQRGKLEPSHALVQLEAMAAAIPLQLYDLAVDAVETVATERHLDLEVTPHRVARVRQDTRPGDADTRRAQRRAARHGMSNTEHETHQTRVRSTQWRGQYGDYAAHVTDTPLACTCGQTDTTVPWVHHGQCASLLRVVAGPAPITVRAIVWGEQTASTPVFKRRVADRIERVVRPEMVVRDDDDRIIPHAAIRSDMTVAVGKGKHAYVRPARVSDGPDVAVFIERVGDVFTAPRTQPDTGLVDTGERHDVVQRVVETRITTTGATSPTIVNTLGSAAARELGQEHG